MRRSDWNSRCCAAVSRSSLSISISDVSKSKADSELVSCSDSGPSNSESGSLSDLDAAKESKNR
jgi:hypothetical protein